MTNYDVVKKLIGSIRPCGDASKDAKRLENLKAMCELMNEIHTDINAIVFDFYNDHQHSVKEAVQVAKSQLNID